MSPFFLFLQDLPDLSAIRESDPVAYTVAAVLLAGFLGLLRLYVLKDKKVDELQEKRVQEALEALVVTKDATSVVHELAELTHQLVDTARKDAGVKGDLEKISHQFTQFNHDLALKIGSLENLIRDWRGGGS